jgi:hypothetical protein
VKVDENFNADVWSDWFAEYSRKWAAQAQWWEERRPRGILHEPSPAVVRRKRRWARRQKLRRQLADLWWDVRWPLRWAGGCREEE